MVEIPFEHKGCDGWAIVDSRYIDAADAKNMHVIEGVIITKETGEVRFRPNSARSTICGEDLKRGEWKYTFCSKDPSEIRSKLVDLQNNGNEACGICASHFYTDLDC